jgi:hypothetical protein
MKGDLYISRINISDYDDEINISFTSIIDNAKKFNEQNYLIFKNLVDLLLNINIDVITVNKDL